MLYQSVDIWSPKIALQRKSKMSDVWFIFLMQILLLLIFWRINRFSNLSIKSGESPLRVYVMLLIDISTWKTPDMLKILISIFWFSKAFFWSHAVRFRLGKSFKLKFEFGAFVKYVPSSMWSNDLITFSGSVQQKFNFGSKTS